MRHPPQAARGSGSSERGRKFLPSEAVPKGGKKFLEEPLDAEWRPATQGEQGEAAVGGPSGSWPCRGLERPYGAQVRAVTEVSASEKASGCACRPAGNGD